MSAELEVDVAVIGAGTAGLAAYRAVVEAGRRAVLIEAGSHGTTCARVGCMPSKLLIAAADAAHDARDAAGFGVETTVSIDGRAVMNRVRRERDRFVGFVLDSVAAIPESDRRKGKARFVSERELVVDGGRIRATSVVVATGASPFVPPPFDAVKDRVVVNDDVFAWSDLPKSIAIFGAGVIGLELGQALSRLGVRVHVYGHRGAVGPLTDLAVREAARAVFAAEFAFDPDAGDVEVKRSERGIDVRHTGAGGPVTESFEFALVAAGRRPNLDGLGLETTGIALSDNGVPAFDRTTLQCGTSSIFVAGDANDEVALLHEAADEGRIAGANAARFPEVVAGHRRSPLSIVFTDPQLAIVGASARSVEGRTDVVAGEVSFEDQGRSRVMRKNRGLLRVYFEVGSRRFLGAEIAGPRAEHLAHLLAWAHQAQFTDAQMLAMPFYHPVVEEGLRTALRDANRKLDSKTS